MKKQDSVDEYISNYRGEKRARLEQMRVIIRKAAPKAEEFISYKMPAYRLNGVLVWFAGHSKHIGFYPRVSAMEVFKEELTDYKTSKGAIQFRYDKPLPVSLITKIIKYRLKENERKAEE